MTIENKLPIGTKVVLNSETLSKEDPAWKKWGNKPRKIIKNDNDIEGDWQQRIYSIDGLKGHLFEREWLIVVDKESICKFMKKKV